MNKPPRNATRVDGWRGRLRTWARRLAWLAVALAALLLLLVAVLRYAPPPISAFMVRRQMHALFRADAPPLRYEWVDLDDLPAHVPMAFVAAEDQLFFDHWGFDLRSIGRAFQHNQRGRRVRGASTLSQQTAKNLFLWPGRSWIRKGLEAGLTVVIELAWPKRRILEVYLNVAEFGDGVYGVGAASRHLLRTRPGSLGRAQAARLAAVLPNPLKYSAARPGPYVRQRAAWIQWQMGRMGVREFKRRLQE